MEIGPFGAEGLLTEARARLIRAELDYLAAQHVFVELEQQSLLDLLNQKGIDPWSKSDIRLQYADAPDERVQYEKVTEWLSRGVIQYRPYTKRGKLCRNVEFLSWSDRNCVVGPWREA
jgi:hypothetical protein